MSAYELVEQYAAIGLKRTGTPGDVAVVDWMSEHLVAAGLGVERWPWTFDRFEASSTVVAEDDEVDHLPVFHEFVGSVDTDRVHVETVDVRFGGDPAVLDPAIERARAAGAEALIVATDHREGSLVAINHEAEVRSGFPVVLVAGRDGERLRDAGRRRVSIDAQHVRAESADVVARTEGAGTPLFVTTPLTGWFGCAGERGTGVAATIEIARRLTQRDVPLHVLATTGHELENLGARRWLAEHTVDASAVLHVGASVGVRDAVRLAMTNLTSAGGRDPGPDPGSRGGRDPGSGLESLVDVVRRAGIELTTGAERWIGEGQLYAGLGVPLLSFSGAGVDFHTPEDTVERATSPALLTEVVDALVEAAAELHRIGVQRLERAERTDA